MRTLGVGSGSSGRSPSRRRRRVTINMNPASALTKDSATQANSSVNRLRKTTSSTPSPSVAITRNIWYSATRVIAAVPPKM